MSGSKYSFSLTTFSPSGELVQIKHALAAITAGATSLGIKATNGVVLATEKKMPSTLVEETSISKIQLLTDEIGITYSGMGPDFRVLTRMARKDTQVYYRTYQESIPCSQLVRETATTMQEFTQQGGVRPFGVSLLMAGYDANGPQLYQVDPSGSYFGWKASAIGKNMINAKTNHTKTQVVLMSLLLGPFILCVIFGASVFRVSFSSFTVSPVLHFESVILSSKRSRVWPYC